MLFNIEKKGFTLAEILITLAIIGVVAALTLPVLVKKYQKHQMIVQLKKAYSHNQPNTGAFCCKKRANI
jgi:prepilin-type N-terminal cleavage/methylation domain-containing protein